MSIFVKFLLKNQTGDKDRVKNREVRWMGRIWYVMIHTKIKKQKEEGISMGSIVSVIMMILLAVVGGFPTIAITVCIPVIIIWKIYRKLKYGYSLYR